MPNMDTIDTICLNVRPHPQQTQSQRKKTRFSLIGLHLFSKNLKNKYILLEIEYIY